MGVVAEKYISMIPPKRMLTLSLLCLIAFPSIAQENYDISPDSLEHPDVPHGKVEKFSWTSDIYPGTERDYWVYVPEQYSPEKPACVMIVQDGLGRARDWKLVPVLDNLIHKKEIPVMIGIFIDPGVVPAPHENAQPRFNRSFEYDAMGDRYARFLLEEILPEVGKSYNLSSDPSDHLLAGASSGAICAFNAAWERPDAFGRVLSTIGTFVGLRGANEFPTLVRLHEAKPIRVFMQDGSSDLNIYAGGWWTANQSMFAALEWAGYDVKAAWGEGGHNGRHGAAILPDAMRWLWRDYPEPVKVGTPKGRRVEVLIPGEDWELVTEGYGLVEGPSINDKGELFFTDIPASKIHKVNLDGTVEEFATDTGRANGLMFGKDGRLYACASAKKQIVAYSPDGSSEVIVEGHSSNDLVILANGGIYFTSPGEKRVHYISPDGEVKVVAVGMDRPNGVTVSADQTLLFVSDTSGRFVFSFQIQPDGTLKHKQEYFHLYIDVNHATSDADGMAVDREGHLYVATDAGLQICDQPGRVNIILDKPYDAWLTNITFGGENLDILYATCGGKVFRRKIQMTGLQPWKEAIKPPRPGL